MLHGRRVGGWIVRIASADQRSESDLPLDKLSPLVSISGMGVEPQIVPLCQWMAESWWGSWRATLSSASAPRVREKVVHSRKTQVSTRGEDAVSVATRELIAHGSGLLVIPPAASALQVVAELVANGPVLAVCPTQRMAVLGAGALRRRGLSVALVPDDWDLARAGVDVVIGARSAVLAPCADLGAIVVVDEHDELLHEERSPTWDASSVAVKRAQDAGVPCVLTSPIPSLRGKKLFVQNTTEVVTEPAWPKVSIVDLASVPVGSSLLSTELLQLVQEKGKTTVCVLNTKGKARLVVCKNCKNVQKCSTCDSLLEQDEAGEFFCRRCSVPHGSVCVACGRSSFVAPRGGVSQLRTQLQASSVNPVIEITSDSEDNWTKGNVFIGTEAVLYRMSSADAVVFADIDRDLSAPRMSASFESLALIARAARMVSPGGQVVIHTRQPSHPLLRALGSEDIQANLRAWADDQLGLFQSLSLPPFSFVARILLSAERSLDELPDLDQVSVAREDSGAMLRASTREQMNSAISLIRHTFGTDVRVHGEPRRF